MNQNGSAEHRSLRIWFDRQLNLRSWNRAGLSPVNWIIVGLIILSAVLYTLETEPQLEAAHAELFQTLNLAILALFAIEFFLRLWSAGEASGIRGLSARTHYAERHWLAIDFIAFAPEVLLMVWLTVSSGQLELSLAGLKVVRLLRLLKLAHFVPGARVLLDTIVSVRNELLASMLIAVAMIFGSAVLMHLAEHQINPESFGSVARSLWWSVVTLTTVGYGDVYPQTLLGKTAAGIIAIAGVALVALPAGIFAGAFSERMREIRRGKTMSASSKDT